MRGENTQVSIEDLYVSVDDDFATAGTLTDGDIVSSVQSIYHENDEINNQKENVQYLNEKQARQMINDLRSYKESCRDIRK